MENVNVRMPTYIKEEMAKRAKEEDRSLSNFLLRIILGNYNNKESKK